MQQQDEVSTNQASVDMAGLVTFNRDEADALAVTARSFITEEDSIEADLRDEDLQFEVKIPSSDSVTKLEESPKLPSIQNQEEDADDQWALSSVASWLSSSVKEATQAIDIPSSILQVSDQHVVQENCDEHDDEEGDDASLANMSLASLISSIGYISTGSRASTPSRRGSVVPHPEAHILQMPESLLDDVSTGSIELVFGDLSGMLPIPIHSGDHQSLKNLLQAERGCEDDVAESPFEKDENDGKQSVNDSPEPSPQIISSEHNSTNSQQAEAVSSESNSAAPSPQTIVASCSEQGSATTQSPPQQTETVSADTDSAEHSPSTVCTDSSAQDSADKQTPEQTEAGSADSNCALSAGTITLPPVPPVDENSFKIQDDCLANADIDIECANANESTDKLNTTVDTTSTAQQSFQEDQCGIKLGAKQAKLDTSSDTSATMQQSFEFDDEEVNSMEVKKAVTSHICTSHRARNIICCGILFVLLLTLGLSLSLVSNKTGALEAVISASPSTSMVPSSAPSDMPSFVPSDLPSVIPSHLPSAWPSQSPSDKPTRSPSQSPSSRPSYENLETTFYAIGDVPYNNREKLELRTHMQNIPPNGEFLIHVGDIRSGQYPWLPCRRQEYMDVRDILLQSKIPVFIIPGDNEWTDCSNPRQAQSFWREAFQEFDKNWDHSFSVQRDPDRPENFYFVHKRTIFFGLNLVGYGSSFSAELGAQYEWVKNMINKHVVNRDTLSIVIFGHAFPRTVHQAFFSPLKRYIKDVLKDDIPIMYLNGDYHFYEFEKKYMGLQNMQRIQVEFGTDHPPLKVEVSVSADPNWKETFSHDRMI